MNDTQKSHKVFVYWNLRKHLWSVRDESTKRVIAHTSEVFLKNCTFVVSEKGRQRVIREKSKNVHAGVRGELDFHSELNIQDFENFKVTYNPYLFNTFVEKNNTENSVLKSELVHMFSDRTVIAI